MEEKGRPAESQSAAAKNPVKVTDVELHLLISDLRDDLSASRKREAAWLSLIVHGVGILLLLFIPKWIGMRPMVIPINQKQETTFLSLSGLSVSPFSRSRNWATGCFRSRFHSMAFMARSRCASIINMYAN